MRRRRRGRGRILGEPNGARSEAYASAFRRLGSATLVAAELGVTKQAASNWLHQARRDVRPPERLVSAPLVSDATFAKCVRLVSTFGMPNEDRWNIVRELIADRYALALDVVRCDDRENANLIEALEEANEEAARTQEGRDIIDDVNSMLTAVYTGLKPEEIFVLPSPTDALREKHEAEAKALELSINKRLPAGVRVRVETSPPPDIALKLAISERDEARAERDGLRAELAATKKKLHRVMYGGKRRRS